MSITQDQIKKITKNLAKLPIAWDKIEHDLNSILWYIKVLNEIDTSWVIPTVSVIKNKSINQYKAKETKTTANPIELLKCSKNKIIAWQIAIWNIMK
jgi:Asp-tRNA(Asn)/Glu-tRNA(Gln) amidotransferase C subunit